MRIDYQSTMCHGVTLNVPYNLHLPLYLSGDCSSLPRSNVGPVLKLIRFMLQQKVNFSLDGCAVTRFHHYCNCNGPRKLDNLIRCSLPDGTTNQEDQEWEGNVEYLERHSRRK